MTTTMITTEPISLPLTHAHGVIITSVSRAENYTNKTDRGKNRQYVSYILFSSNRVFFENI